MDINYSFLQTAIPSISLSFVLWIFALYFITSVSKTLFFPIFNNFFSKALVKIDIRILYMFLIYILLSFIYTFMSTPILDFIISNGDSKIYLKISMIFGISLTGILRILSTKENNKNVPFIIFLQIAITSLALIICYNFIFKGSNYFLKIQNEFLDIIELGIFQDVFSFLVVLFIFIEGLFQRIPPRFSLNKIKKKF